MSREGQSFLGTKGTAMEKAGQGQPSPKAQSPKGAPQLIAFCGDVGRSEILSQQTFWEMLTQRLGTNTFIHIS